MAKGIAHEIHADFIRVRQVLGRTPSKEEYLLQSAFSYDTIKSVFGGWQKFLNAVGVQYSIKGKRNAQEKKKEAFLHLQGEIEKKKAAVTPPKLIRSLICVSDMHHPYGHPDTAPFLRELNNRFKFDHCLIGGDETDQHAISFHDHDPDLLSPGHELEVAIDRLKEIQAIFPKADVLDSNHGSLYFRKGKHHGLPRQVLKSYSEVLQAPGWTWKEEFEFQFNNGKKAVAHHGYSSNILLASKKRAQSLIQFHFHSSFSIQYWKNREDLFFAMQCGCLVDDDSLAMAYNKLTIERPIIGVGAVIEGNPLLLPMHLDRHKRWTGKI